LKFGRVDNVGRNIEVLVLDDEAIVCERLKEFLDGKGLKVETFTESARAVARLREKKFDVVVTDMKMPGPTGMDVLKFIKGEQPSTQAIVITGYGAIESFRETEALGAYDYVTKPFKVADIYNLIVKAAKHAKKDQT
jgi:DNA-binding NtrC family response regulator